MLIFIILALPILAIEVAVRFVVAIAFAEPLSGICRLESFDCSRRGASVVEGHFETTDHLWQGNALHLAGRPTAGSSLVRRLVLAKDDPAKQRIRARLSAIDDARLFCLGLTSEDIAALRGVARAPAESTIQGTIVEATIAEGSMQSSEDSGASCLAPPIAGLADATDDLRRRESDTPRRERVARYY